MKKKNLFIFITHTFNRVLLDNIKSINEGDIIVLFDESAKPAQKYELLNDEDKGIVDGTNVIWQKINKNMTYDTDKYGGGGHTMYIEYLRHNNHCFNEYEYIWILENDVFYFGDINNFIKGHEERQVDVLIPQMGGRGIPAFGEKWIWEDTLSDNLKELYEYKGVLAYCARYSSKYLAFIVNNIEKEFKGFFEAITPIICKKYGFSIETFNRNQLGHIGIHETDYIKNILYKIIKKEMQGVDPMTVLLLEGEAKNRLHHPVKL